MPNIFWYISLAVLGIVSTVYTLYKKRKLHKTSTLLTYYLYAAGITWIGEFAVLGLLNAYSYKTGIFKDIWAQNLLGHLVINTTLYPAAAVIMIAYSLRYGWMAFMAALFTSFEYLFLKLGIYEQHWWRLYMTPVIVIGILLMQRKGFEKISEKPEGLTRAVFYFFAAVVVIHLPAPILLLSGKQQYQLYFINKLVGDATLADIIIIFSFNLLEAFLAAIFTCILKRWYWKAAPFIISLAAQIIFFKLGILVIANGWSLIYSLAIYLMFIAAFILIEKYTFRAEHTKFF